MDASRQGEWTAIARICAGIARGEIHPARGANAVWGSWDHSKEPLPAQVEMLQLCDAWEQSVGEAAQTIEREIVEYARTVVIESKRHLEQ